MLVFIYPDQYFYVWQSLRNNHKGAENQFVQRWEIRNNPHVGSYVNPVTALQWHTDPRRDDGMPLSGARRTGGLLC